MKARRLLLSAAFALAPEAARADTLDQALVLADDTPSAIAALVVLQTFNVPYLSYSTAESLSFDSIPLHDVSGNPNFSMIVLGSGQLGLVHLYLPYDLNVLKTAFSTSQWSQIHAYQNANHVRLVAMYDYPGAGVGWEYTTLADSFGVGNSSVTVSPASTIGSTSAGLDSNFSITFHSGLGIIYPTTITNTSAVTPVLYFANVEQNLTVAACVYTFSATQEQLSFFYQISAWNDPPNQAVVFGSDTPSAIAALLTLQTFDVPFVSYSVSQSLSLSTLPLYDSNQNPNFSMIILGSGQIGFSQTQWNQIFQYQQDNTIRLVALYDYPGVGSSWQYTSLATSASNPFSVVPGYRGIVKSAGISITFSIDVNSGTSELNTNFTQQHFSFLNNLSFVECNLDFVELIVTIVSATSSSSTLAISLAQSSNITSVYVQNRALILSPGDGSEEYPQKIFQAYGLAYDTVVINTQNLGAQINLEVEANVTGKYSLIVLSSGQMIAGFSNGSYLSTLYFWQWNQIHNYQRQYGVRLVAINDNPTSSMYSNLLFSVGGKYGCDSSTELWVSPSTNQYTTPAAMKSGWTLAAGDGISGGSCNFPATILNTTYVTAVLDFKNLSSTVGTAAAVVNFGSNQQQLSIFMPCGSWSITCCTISHIWFQWATYGLYTGLRSGLDENNVTVSYRTTPSDVQGLISWMYDFNTRMPTGSNVTFELAFNGNGILRVISNSTYSYFLNFTPSLTDTPLNWVKPLGTGMTLWPNISTLDLNWTKSLGLDPLYQYLSPENAQTTTSKFLWISHTFTHEILNNNSYSDTLTEMNMNFRMASSNFLDLVGKQYWSNNTLVTPGISGLFNGDALRALYDFGVKGAVGDSSRPPTLNSNRPLYWPMTTTAAANGFDGFTVVPRQSLNIYFNCTNQNYNTMLYNGLNPNAGTVDFAYIMNTEVKRNVRLLALLSWNPVMFHQSNLRNADMPAVSAGTAVGAQKLGLAQQWIENVFGNFTEFVNWPLLSVKLDDLTQKFVERMIYETAGVTVTASLTLSSSGVTFTGFSVSSNATCVAPVTLPYGVSPGNLVLPAGVTTDQVGGDSVTLWIPVQGGGASVEVGFATPVLVSSI
ncbi:hypothetical protein HDU83_005446 [Entophlyctis luteolus]|nr:hypothetical protein HDU83_005446 [Entophlyctis luteolus]